MVKIILLVLPSLACLNDLILVIAQFFQLVLLPFNLLLDHDLCFLNRLQLFLVTIIILEKLAIGSNERFGVGVDGGMAGVLLLRFRNFRAEGRFSNLLHVLLASLLRRQTEVSAGLYKVC